MPSCAVTTVVITLDPTASAIADEGVPLATVTVLTLTVAVASATVGVTVMDVVVLGTEMVYAMVAWANAGVKVPLFGTRFDRLALFDAALVTVMV